MDSEVRPPSPVRLPRTAGGDGVLRIRGGLVARALHFDEGPVVVAVWQRSTGEVALRAAGAVPARSLERAIARMRFAFSLDVNLSDFFSRFRSDPLIGPAIRRHPWRRPRRRPVAWEALAWAITGQLIEASRAAQIQRRIVRRHGPQVDPATFAGERVAGFAALPKPLRNVPAPAIIAALAPAQLAAYDLAPARALAMIRVAKEVASGRVDPADPSGDARLAAIPEIGPWTLECLGQNGRGDLDSLPAGDLAYVKLVGRLTSLGRRATVEEVHDFFAPYEPYRSLAGEMALSQYHLAVPAGPPVRLAA